MSFRQEPGAYAVECYDRQGRIVRYTRSNYERHLQKHPEMDGFAEDIATDIQDPDIEIDADNGHIYLYRTGLGAPKYERLWLFVVVLYGSTNGQYEGVVKTAYFTSKLPKDGELTWKR